MQSTALIWILDCETPEWIPALHYLSTNPLRWSPCPSLCQEGLLIPLFLCVHSSQYDVTAPTPYWPPAGHRLPEVGRELPAGWAAGGGDPAPAQVEGCLQADAQPVVRPSRLSFPASSFLGCISSLHHQFLQPQPSARLPFVVLFLLLAQLCGWCSSPSFFTYASSFFPAYGPHTWFFLLRCLPALTQRQSWVSIFFSVPHMHHVWSVFLAPISHHCSLCLWVLSLTIFLKIMHQFFSPFCLDFMALDLMKLLSI